MHHCLNGDIENFVQVAQDIWTLPVLSDKTCDAIVSKLQSAPFEPQSNDLLPIEEIMLDKFDKDFTTVINQYIEYYVGNFYYKNYNNTYFKVLTNWINRLGAAVIDQDVHNDGIALHSDKSRVSMSLILNDDFEGGDLYFPRQEYKTADVPKGTLICWPGQITHPHTILPVTQGTRYSLVTFTKLESFSTRERQLSNNFQG
jgi:hypothetical protein